ncbi:MAG: nitrate ABC transporter permease [Actinobacteria bacterium]|jgi:NitT/TauT family transport system permease protein|nr:nitrate ABC transporter permease [Actinomycetota bacterium]MCS5671411.1 ABC transporter permease [Acidimicrobiales bacterium]|tara:strand:+ start:6273 stop:7073 length:801 start_codon:yes stop_codon:yes gene_type:complete
MIRNRLAGLGPPIVVGVAGLGLWEGVVWGFGIRKFLLPKPSSIIARLSENWPILRHAGWETGRIALSGLVVGIVAGIVLALVTTRFRTLNEGLTPLAVAVNATPIVALAPIFNAWFGITGTLSNQAVVVAIVFFPVFINTARGLTEVHPDELELMRSYASSEWTILREVRIPNAMPFFANALRVVAPLSVIAAIVAEYFGGPQDRIGNVITSNVAFVRYDVAWAAIAVASALGLALFAVALLVERVSMPWRAAMGDGEYTTTPGRE